MKTLLLAALLVPAPALARVHAFSMVTANGDLGMDLDALRRDLEASSFTVHGIVCRSGNCEVMMPDSETKNPAAIIAAFQPTPKPKRVSPAARRALVLELRDIQDRFEANTDTAADRRRLLKIVLLLAGLSLRDP